MKFEHLTIYLCNGCDKVACELTTEGDEVPEGCPLGRTPDWKRGYE